MIFNIFIKSFRKAIFRLNDIIKIKKITRKMLFLNLVLPNGAFSAFFFNHFLTKYRVFGFHLVPYAFFHQIHYSSGGGGGGGIVYIKTSILL